ncbi:phospholipid phosphatase 4 isoform X2 [Uranotaenia lowii]|nr:phospholipid phosphatase 4 isoform X2 [Uranotaenia lowii]
MWLYRNPRTSSYVPLNMLYPTTLILAGLIFATYYVRSKDFEDLKSAWLGLTLSIALNGVITHSIKCAVGRPRPDFFWRCFPDGQMNDDMVCTGDKWTVSDGRKSFPSGHSSYAFSVLGFLAWYLFAKLHVFTERGRGQSWRLIAALCPLWVAVMVAISRTCDYHHHWQDVSVGSIIGIIESYLCYRQYYPSIGSQHCHVCYSSGEVKTPIMSRKISPKPESSSCPTEPEEKKLLSTEDKDSRWT